ncbi:MAG TPA: tetratricopeptide repeat protein [Polyangia bacterium]|nr:tetratricopeptide repeat protein [Polyangia bacterium]
MKMLTRTDLRNTLTAGLGLGLLLAACGGTSPPPKPKTVADENDQVIGGHDAESSGLGGGGKLSPEQIVPKAKKREISEDQRAEFDKAMARYQSAKKSGGLSGGECSSVADAFKSAAEGTPVLLEALFNQGAVLQECGREDEAIRIWQGMTEGKTKYGPAMTNLGYIAWKQNEPGRAEALFSRAIESDPLHTVEARNNLAQILRDKARRASSPEEKKTYVGQAVTHLRNVLALDSNNLQAFATLAFIYYEMNMLEMAKLVGNQAIHKAEEIATGKFEEEKAEEAADGKAGKGKKEKKKKETSKDDDEEGKLAREVNVREAGTGVTAAMKVNLAVVHNTLGLVELKRKNISPAITQFRKAVEMNPAFNEARLNLAALSLNNRDYKTAEENFHAVLEAQPKNFEASLGLGVALRGGKKIEEAEAQYEAAQKLDPSNPSSYFNLGLLYQEYKDGQKPSLQKAQSYYRQFLSHANSTTGDNLQREAQKRIKDIDEIYVALEEAAKMQAEAEEMQRKAEAQQKEMEEKMKQQEAQEKAEAEKAKVGGSAPAGSEAPKEGAAKDAAGAKPAEGGGAAPAATPFDDSSVKPGKKKKGKK